MNKVTVVSTGMETQHWLPTPDKRALVRPSGLSRTAGKVAGDKPSWDACSEYAHTHGPYQWSSTRSAAQARLTAIAVEYGSPSHPLHDRSLLAAKLSNSNLKLHILNVCAHFWPAAWLVHTDHTVAYSWWCKAWTSTIFCACNPHQTFEKFISKVERDYANFALRYGFTLSRCALPWSHNLRQSSPESKVSWTPLKCVEAPFPLFHGRPFFSSFQIANLCFRCGTGKSKLWSWGLRSTAVR